MGEYIKYKGESTKVGTCESLYYASFQSFLAAAPCLSMDGSSTVESYLKADSGYRFRFPFPDEDGREFGQPGEDFNRGLLVSVKRELLNEEWHGGWDKAGTWVTSRTQPKLKFYAKDIPNPNNTAEVIHLEILQQKFTSLGLLLCYRCPFSDETKRVEDPAAIVSLVHAISVTYMYEGATDFDFWDKVCQRIFKGYNLPYESKTFAVAV